MKMGITIKISQDLDFYDLKHMAWSGAKNTIATVEEHEKEEELMDLLREHYVDEDTHMAHINDILWFESERIYEILGISEEEVS